MDYAVCVVLLFGILTVVTAADRCHRCRNGRSNAECNTNPIENCNPGKYRSVMEKRAPTACEVEIFKFSNMEITRKKCVSSCTNPDQLFCDALNTRCTYCCYGDLCNVAQYPSQTTTPSSTTRSTNRPWTSTPTTMPAHETTRSTNRPWTSTPTTMPTHETTRSTNRPWTTPAPATTRSTNRPWTPTPTEEPCCPEGPPGPVGHPGLPGAKGDVGIPGRPGLPGVDGPPGLPGIDGLPGATGPNGESGDKGSQGWPGPPGIKGDKGTVDKAYLDSLKGMKGDPGDRGTPGRPGTDGQMGECKCPDDLKKPYLAFSVFTSGVEQKSNNYEHITIAKVITDSKNLDGGISLEYMDFVAPVDGIYVFHATSVGNGNSAVPLVLFRGTTEIIVMTGRSDASATGVYPHGSAHATLELQRGQTVSLVIRQKRQSWWNWVDLYSPSDVTFSGFLLAARPKSNRAPTL